MSVQVPQPRGTDARPLVSEAAAASAGRYGGPPGRAVRKEVGAAARLWHLEGRGRGRLSRGRAGVSGLGERLGAPGGPGSLVCSTRVCVRAGQVMG